MRRPLDLETASGLLAAGAVLGALLLPLLWLSRATLRAARGERAGAAREARATPPAAAPLTAPAATPDPPAAPALERPLVLQVPVRGVKRAQIVDTFDERRGHRRHGALDIHAPRGRAVLAATDCQVARLSSSRDGGREIYLLDASGRYCLYHAHLQGYARGLRLGQNVAAGETIGFVGSTGNAPTRAPHLHFALFRNHTPGRCGGNAIDPLALMR
jgi:murein DD-endopeptidase MepM/ murein hydrolase activator NlpD